MHFFTAAIALLLLANGTKSLDFIKVIMETHHHSG